MTECSSDRVFKPLAGIRVADFSWVIASPWLTKILAYFGAEVIRIESRSRPDAIRLCQAIGSPAWTDQPEFATFLNRRRNREPLDRHLSAWTRQHSAEEVMRRLQAHGVRAGVVQHIADLTEHDPHLQARHFFAPVSHTILSDLPISDLPMHLSATPGAYASAGPCIGEHNAYVYGDLLGMTDTEIATYTAQGIFN